MDVLNIGLFSDKSLSQYGVYWGSRTFLVQYINQRPVEDMEAKVSRENAVNGFDIIGVPLTPCDTVETVCRNCRRFVRVINELIPVWLCVTISESTENNRWEEKADVRVALRKRLFREQFWNCHVRNWSLCAGIESRFLPAVVLCI